MDEPLNTNSAQPSPRRFSDVPFKVLASDTWPFWRRLTMCPDSQTRSRIQAWRELAHHAPIATPAPTPNLHGSRRPGIFDGSMVYWDHLVGHGGRGTTFQGLVRSGEHAKRVSITNPHGPLIVTGTVNEFNCDITDVEGISSSKSSELHFDSVDEFGRYYRDYHGAALTPDGLEHMLSHGEVRIIHSPGADTFRIAMWDGRLFLANHGGSHHFAGAAHIAKAIGKAVPLSARVHIHWLNEPAWEWLLAGYRFIHSSATPRRWSRMDVAKLAGECYAIELPPRFDGGELVLVPCSTPALSPLIDVLAQHGAADVTSELRTLLQAQATARQSLALRWPQICTPPWLAHDQAPATLPDVNSAHACLNALTGAVDLDARSR